MTILVTGAAGYIGSHTVLSLLEGDYSVVAVDNLVNGSAESLRRVEQLTGKQVPLVVADLRDKEALAKVFREYTIESVIHFAGLKAVGESVKQPLSYYSANVYGTLCLWEVMQEFGVKRLIFSSSATVYGQGARIPYIETMPRGKTSSPYGTSKAMVEQMLTDIVQADENAAVSLLRYFNPIGAHPSGEIGEDPKGTPNNLMPFIAQVAVGRRDYLSVFGDDYPTADGTCERDYLHVMDLAEGHVKALQAVQQPGLNVYNLGTGSATSVLTMIKTFEQVAEVCVPYKIAPRRAGDLAAFWADASKAETELGWKATRSLNDMMRDTWHWQKKNPKGYEDNSK